METFTIPLETTSCIKCEDHFATDFKFCPDCGKKLIRQILPTLEELLRTEILLPDLIYNNPTGTETFSMKFKTLFNELGTFNLSHCLSINRNGEQIYFDFDAKTEPVNVKYSDMMETYFNNPSAATTFSHGIPDAHTSNNTIDTRIISKHPILQQMNIPHTYAKICCFEKDTLEALLIILLENWISDPRFGDRFVLVPDKELKYPVPTHWDYWTYPTNYQTDSENVITMKMMHKTDLAFSTENNDLKKSILDKLQKKIDKQTEIYDLLDQIKVDLYYSPRNSKIYTRDELVKLLNIDNLETYCEDPFRVRNIRTYVVRDALDTMFDFAEMRESFQKIEGVIGKKELRKFIGINE